MPGRSGGPGNSTPRSRSRRYASSTSATASETPTNRPTSARPSSSPGSTRSSASCPGPVSSWAQPPASSRTTAGISTVSV